MEEKINVKCPECGIEFVLESDAEEGDVIDCPGCDAELELDSLEPPELVPVKYDDISDEIDEDDWDDKIWEEDEVLEDEEDF